MKSLARREDRAELIDRLRTVRPENPRRWGRMTAHQMVCHLADGFRVALGELPVTVRTNLFRRTILKGVALHAPLRWPPGIATSAEIDQLVGGTAPKDFAADLAQVVELLERMGPSGDALGRHAHPLFGSMSRTDWLRWGYLHTDHHLRQFGA